MPATKPTPALPEEPATGSAVVVQGPFGGDEPGGDPAGAQETPKGGEAPVDIPAVYTKSVARNTTFSARSQDVLLALQAELRRRGLENPLEPFAIGDLVEFAIEGIANRISRGIAWEEVVATVKARGRTREPKPRRGKAAKS